MTEQELNLSPTRPYLARAIYEWICDNQLTPHLLVNATHPQAMFQNSLFKTDRLCLILHLMQYINFI